MADELNTIESHNLMLENRNRLRLTGVTDVDSFDENTIIAYTVLGELTISGSSLHINKLNTENGELTVEGNIASMIYLDNAPKGGGFFSKMFR